MLRKTAIGLDIHFNQLRAASVQWISGEVVLRKAAVATLEVGCLAPGFTVPNVLQPQLFVVAIKELLAPLTGGNQPFGVVLPDQAGRLFVVEMDTPFKNRAEGLEVVRWQLRDELPNRSERVFMDYQVLAENVAGRKTLLVAVIGETVLAQYEDLLQQAGYPPYLIDFHLPALYNASRSSIERTMKGLFIGIDGQQLVLLFQTNGVPSFVRSRFIESDPNLAIQEINRSLANLRSHKEDYNLIPVYLHCDWPAPLRQTLQPLMEGFFEQKIEWLGAPFGQGKGIAAGVESAGFSAAFATAGRLIQRGHS